MNKVLNADIGSPTDLWDEIPNSYNAQKILAGFFEQLLIFDEIIVTTGRSNFQLYFLLQKLGLASVDRLVSEGALKFLLWTPLSMTITKPHKGQLKNEDVYGRPPFVAGTLGDEDLDPEKNIRNALDRLDVLDWRKKNFIRKALEAYTVPDGMAFAKNATELVISAYEDNSLAALGLPYNKEPNYLDIPQRHKLHSLSNKVIETAILSEYNLKSFENYEAYEICKVNYQNIGKAYQVSENTSNLFRIENAPSLKEIFLDGKLDILEALRIRNYGTAEYYRNWINRVGENTNINEVSEAYIQEIKGKNKFFASRTGRFVKNLTIFGIGTFLQQAIAGATVGNIASYGLGFLDEFVLNNLLQGKNPSMFINLMKNEIRPPATLENP